NRSDIADRVLHDNDCLGRTKEGTTRPRALTRIQNVDGGGVFGRAKRFAQNDNRDELRLRSFDSAAVASQASNVSMTGEMDNAGAVIVQAVNNAVKVCGGRLTQRD